MGVQAQRSWETENQEEIEKQKQKQEEDWGSRSNKEVQKWRLGEVHEMEQEGIEEKKEHAEG